MLSYRDRLYAFSYDVKAERYDPVFDCWSALDHLELPAENPAGFNLVRGEIYFIEVNTSSEKSTIKRFNVERCLWQTVSSSHEGCRVGSCVVAAGNHLYVCGGWLEDDCVSKAERYDTVENKWEEIANMQQERGNAFGVATEGKIFVAGGREDWESYLKTCEMFHISTNEWQFIGNLTVDRLCGSMICLKGTLYVLGGTHDDKEGPLIVECYDPTEDKWIKKTTIPVEMTSRNNKDTFSGCVLKLSKGVLDKLDVIKE